MSLIMERSMNATEVIKYLDSVIATDDDGCQWLTVEFDEICDKINWMDPDYNKLAKAGKSGAEAGNKLRKIFLELHTSKPNINSITNNGHLDKTN